MILSFRRLSDLTGLSYRLIHSWVDGGIIPADSAAQYGNGAKIRSYKDEGLFCLALAAFLTKTLHLKGSGVRAAVQGSLDSVRAGRGVLAIFNDQHGEVWINLDPPALPDEDDEENACQCFDLVDLFAEVGKLPINFKEFPTPAEILRTEAAK